MTIKKVDCENCEGKGTYMRSYGAHEENIGEYEKKCHQCKGTGKRLVKVIGGKCPDCSNGLVKWTQETGSIIPGFRTRSWTENCTTCYGTAREVKLLFECHTCYGKGSVTYTETKKGLFGWRHVENKYKCKNCDGVGYR